MKSKVLVLVLALMLVAGVVYAEQTGGAEFQNKYLRKILNHTNKHDHSYTDNNTWREERDNPIGLGLDVIVYKFGELPTAKKYGLDNVKVVQRYDFANEEYALFGVMTIDIDRGFRGLLGGE